jgi:hypothetical protein
MTDTIQLGVYQHYKGNKYLVLGVAMHSETLEKLVVYVTLYDNELAHLWVRPLTMFAGDVVVAGEVRPRFRWIGNDEQA